MTSRLRDDNVKRLFLILLMASLVVSALTGIVIFIVGDFDKTQLKLLLTALTLGGFSLIGLGCSLLLGRKGHVFLPYAGITTSAVGFVLFITGIWGEVQEERFWKSTASFAIVAFSLAHISVLLFGESRNRLVKYTLSSTISVIFSLTLALIIMMILELDEEIFFRFLGVLAILDVLGSISVPLLKKATSSAA